MTGFLYGDIEMKSFASYLIGVGNAKTGVISWQRRIPEKFLISGHLLGGKSS